MTRMSATGSLGCRRRRRFATDQPSPSLRATWGRGFAWPYRLTHHVQDRLLPLKQTVSGTLSIRRFCSTKTTHGLRACGLSINDPQFAAP
jgi:hypothetical protein